MPIDNVNKCIFIHIPKNAGSSIIDCLSIVGEKEESLYGRIDLEDIQLYGFEETQWHHLTYKEICKVLERDIVDSYYKFAIIRNPWDRMVSWYHYRKRRELKLANGLSRENYTGRISFSEFIKSLPSELVRQQCEWIVDEDGKVAVDKLGKVETLDSDFQEISTKLGIINLLPRYNISKHFHYSCYYDNESRDLVSKIFRDDISMFGYVFERINLYRYIFSRLLIRLSQMLKY